MNSKIYQLVDNTNGSAYISPAATRAMVSVHLHLHIQFVVRVCVISVGFCRYMSPGCDLSTYVESYEVLRSWVKCFNIFLEKNLVK